MIQSVNKEVKQGIYEKEGAIVQYALKNCPYKLKTISDKCNLSIEQMTEICNGSHPYLKDYVVILTCCLNMLVPLKKKFFHIVAVLYNRGVEISKDDIVRLFSGDSSNPMEYEKVLYAICNSRNGNTKPSKKQSNKRLYYGLPRINGGKASSYYKQPYTKTAGYTYRTNEYEYGLTDT